jgi:hypothetical protein
MLAPSRCRCPSLAAVVASAVLESERASEPLSLNHLLVELRGRPSEGGWNIILGVLFPTAAAVVLCCCCWRCCCAVAASLRCLCAVGYCAAAVVLLLLCLLPRPPLCAAELADSLIELLR